jgi:hypothetical protein
LPVVSNEPLKQQKTCHSLSVVGSLLPEGIRQKPNKIAGIRIFAVKTKKKYAGGGSRTHTALRPTDFESAASAIPPLRRVIDSTRHAPVAKALLDALSLFTLRSMGKD